MMGKDLAEYLKMDTDYINLRKSNKYLGPIFFYNDKIIPYAKIHTPSCSSFLI